MKCILEKYKSFFLQWADDEKLFEILILSMLIPWTIALNLLTCEAGDRLSDQLDQFALEIDGCEWISLPIEIKRIYLIFLMDIHQPIFIQIGGNIACKRKTFKNVPIELHIETADIWQFNACIFFAALIFRLPPKDFHTFWRFANFENGLIPKSIIDKIDEMKLSFCHGGMFLGFR